MLSLEDKFEITNLISHYARLVDDGHKDAWVALYTEDGIFEVPGIVYLQGHAKLGEMVDQIQAIGQGKVRHQITNLYITAGSEPESAHIKAYSIVSNWLNGFHPVSSTDYDIAMVKLDGLWKFKRILATPLAPPDV